MIQHNGFGNGEIEIFNNCAIKAQPASCSTNLSDSQSIKISQQVSSVTAGDLSQGSSVTNKYHKNIKLTQQKETVRKHLRLSPR